MIIGRVDAVHRRGREANQPWVRRVDLVAAALATSGRRCRALTTPGLPPAPIASGACQCIAPQHRLCRGRCARHGWLAGTRCRGGSTPALTSAAAKERFDFTKISTAWCYWPPRTCWAQQQARRHAATNGLMWR